MEWSPKHSGEIHNNSIPFVQKLLYFPIITINILTHTYTHTRTITKGWEETSQIPNNGTSVKDKWMWESEGTLISNMFQVFKKRTYTGIISVITVLI